MDIGDLTGRIAIEDQFSSVLDHIASRVESFASNFEGALGTIAVGVGVGVAAVTAMTAAVTALASKGSDINDVVSTFEHFAERADGAEMTLQSLRAGVKGTVDDLILMKDANKILSVGVKMSADDFGTLGQAAFVLQNRGLGGTTEMLDMVSQALVTGRTRTLAMKLGVVDAADAEQDYANQLGILKRKMTETQTAEAGRIAIMNMLRSAVTDAGDQQLDFGEKIELVETKVKNWVDRLSSIVATSPNVAKAFDTIVGAIGGLADGDELLNTIVGAVNTFADAVTASVPYITTFAKGVKLGVEALYDLRYIFEAIAIRWLIVNGLAAASILVMAPAGIAAAATASGYGALNVALAGTALAAAPVVIAMAGIAASLTIGYQIWKLFGENAERAAAAERQVTVDSSNLAILNAKLGTTFTDVNKASAEWIKRNKDAKPAVDDHSKAVATAAAQAKAYKDSVQGVVDSVTILTQQLYVDRDAYKKLGNQIFMTKEAQDKFISSMEKYTEAGRKLMADEQKKVDIILEARIASDQYGEAQLKQKGITLELIETGKALGLSEQELALHWGVSASALKTYGAEMQTTQKLARELADLQMELSGSTTDKAISDHKREADAAILLLNIKSATYVQDVQAYRDAQNKKDALTIRSLGTSISGSKQAADQALSDYNRMVASGDFYREELDKQYAKYLELKDAATRHGQAAVGAENAATEATRKHNEELDRQKAVQDAIIKNDELIRSRSATFEVTAANLDQAITQTSFGRTSVTGFNPGGSGYTLRARELAKEGYSFSEILDILRGGDKRAPMGPAIPGFGSTTPATTQASQPAETPPVQMPAGASAGQSKGWSINVTNNFHGITMDDAVKKVGDSLMRTVMIGRQLPWLK